MSPEICISISLIICNFFLCTFAQNYTYDVKYFTVPVDHFSFSNNATFKLRYLINKSYWDAENGPIFFYTGNEGDIEMFANNTGFMWEIAPAFSALIVFAEHRYYGESLPFGNLSFTSPKYVGYLSSSQALADYVNLINDIQTSNKNQQNKKNPVIVFGGSYGGMLAAWIRMKYPFIVSGAIASSAPVLQFTGLTPCGAFARIVTSNYKIALTPECSKSISKSWKELRNIVSNDAGKAWLSTEWRLCTPIKTHDDIENFVSWLTDVYGNIAMINYPYPTDFLTPVPAFPIRVMCSKLRNSTVSGKQLISALHKAVSIYTNYTGEVKCLNMQTTAGKSLGVTGWKYQSCTEMVMPMCTDGENDMFEKNPWDYKKFSDSCFKEWGVRPQINMALLEYGGKNLQAFSNIVFSNGLLDPWSAGGVLKNMSRSIYAILIPEGAHHLDLRASNPNDPESVRQARNFHKRAIQLWIGQYHMMYKIHKH